MLESPHVAVAAAIATKIPNPVIAIPLAFASHFVLELVPHWNPHLNTEFKKHGRITAQTTQLVVADSFLALTLGVWVAGRALPNTSQALVILAACFAAVIPDIVEAPYFFLHHKNSFIEKTWIPFKKSIQVDSSVALGIFTQIIILAASFAWIFS